MLTPLTTRVSTAALPPADEQPGQCDCFLALADAGEGRFGEAAILWEGGEGNPIGIEFLGRPPCRSG